MKCGIHFGDLKRFKKKFEQAFGKDADCGPYIKEILKTSAARCQRRTEQRTPVDTGQLRKNWFIGDPHKAGWDYRVKVYNPVEYTTYVEFGHRYAHGQTPGRYVPQIGKKLVREWVEGGWVEGHFMLTKSIDESKEDLPDVAEEVLIKKFLEITK